MKPNALILTLAAFATLAACTVDPPKDDDTGDFSTGGGDGGGGDGGGDGAGPPGSLTADFVYAFDFGADGRCALNATAAGAAIDASCPDCDFTLERAYVVEFTVGDPTVEGVCADSPYAELVRFDAAQLDYYAGIWGFGAAGGQDVLVMAYNYGYEGSTALYYTLRLTDGAWDRSGGAFDFSYTVDYASYGYGEDTGYYGYGVDAPPPAAEPTGQITAVGAAR